MHHLFLALLWAAPLVIGCTAYEAPQSVPAPEPAALTETAYLSSMGCDLADCADPTHFHHCAVGCTEADHYHDCPVGCQEAAHGHGEHHEEPLFCPSMGCTLTDCTDPTHYHHCASGCADPAHYHDCPVGCQDAGHAHSGVHHSESRGHHGSHHS